MDPLQLKPVQKLFELVVDPMVRLLFAAAIFYFIYGVFKFIKDKAMGESADLEQGANHVLWGVIGIFIMLSVWGIIAILRNTIGVK